MVPRGNIVHCLLKENQESLTQDKFNVSGKVTPDDILEIENEMVDFLESGITSITREGSLMN